MLRLSYAVQNYLIMLREIFILNEFTPKSCQNSGIGKYRRKILNKGKFTSYSYTRKISNVEKTSPFSKKRSWYTLGSRINGGEGGLEHLEVKSNEQGVGISGKGGGVSGRCWKFWSNKKGLFVNMSTVIITIKLKS